MNELLPDGRSAAVVVLILVYREVVTRYHHRERFSGRSIDTGVRMQPFNNTCGVSRTLSSKVTDITSYTEL